MADAELAQLSAQRMLQRSGERRVLEREPLARRPRGNDALAAEQHLVSHLPKQELQSERGRR